MGKRSVFAMIMDFATEKGEILHRILEGNVLDNTKNAIAAFTFKDSDGNAVFPTLKPDGAIVVSGDAGTPYAISDIKLIAAQTKDLREEYLFIDLDVDPLLAVKYSTPDFKVSSFSECRVEMELIVDATLGGEVITPLGYALTSDAYINDRQRIRQNFFDVPAAATTAKIRLMVTPYEEGNQADDILMSMSVNKLA